jgi:hypothetical protein
VKRWKLNNARVFVQGQNLVSWFSFKGYDPEVFTGVLSGAVFPNLKAVTAGVSIGL